MSKLFKVKTKKKKKLFFVVRQIKKLFKAFTINKKLCFSNSNSILSIAFDKKQWLFIKR